MAPQVGQSSSIYLEPRCDLEDRNHAERKVGYFQKRVICKALTRAQEGKLARSTHTPPTTSAEWAKNQECDILTLFFKLQTTLYEAPPNMLRR